ncbi:hypothetical protein [Anaerosphaera multitolerans]|uniref:Lipoprotein n=1 Tax=Anaerosphaera multitolerans TaxID=2487351 RepID=A0A437S9B4_9FIRM|nr:hypothetical protein [Anaerosphaera multitolerans]RVU55699.1 hypothetical protein EF514_00340 [Anaerosphaera multitolerans]
MKKLYILILTLFLVGCGGIHIGYTNIEPIPVDISNKELNLYRSILGESRFFRIKPPENSLSYSTEVYLHKNGESKLQLHSSDNFTVLPKTGFNIGCGLIYDKFVFYNESKYKTDTFSGQGYGTSSFQGEESTKSYQESSRKFLDTKVKDVELNEPVILELLSFSNKNTSEPDYKKTYMKEYEFDNERVYYIFTITFYDYDITKQDMPERLEEL